MLDSPVAFSIRAATILSEMRRHIARMKRDMTSTVQLTRESIRQSQELMRKADGLLASHSRWLDGR